MVQKRIAKISTKPQNMESDRKYIRLIIKSARWRLDCAGISCACFGRAAMESHQLVDSENKESSTDYNALFGGKEEPKFTQKTVFGEVRKVCVVSLECASEI